MSFSEMSLPTDIPWKRAGISKDMIEQGPEFSPFRENEKWRNSIAVFYHEPPDLPPEYCNRKITYLKISCTITNYIPEGNQFFYDHEFSSLRDRNIHEGTLSNLNLISSLPCHGALLSVRVLPKPSRDVEIELHDYPYVSSFQPQKREMYELISRSGETLSQSDSNINVSKGATNSIGNEYINSSENINVYEARDLDRGGGGDSSSWVLGIYSESDSNPNKEVGDIGRNESKTGNRDTSTTNSQSQNIQTTDTSRSNRESFSFSSNISQLYSLLKGYHLGTNRVQFLIEPRPHIQEPNIYSFVRGPRKLDGIQEFFLIINRPKKIEGLCVAVDLETIHFGQKNKYKAKVIPYSDLFQGNNLNKTPEALGVSQAEMENLFGPLVVGVNQWNSLSNYARYLYWQYNHNGGSPPGGDFQVMASELILGNPNLNIEEAAIILEKYISYDGSYFVVGNQVSSCFSPTNAEDGNVDIENSSQENISEFDGSSEASILYEGQNLDFIPGLSNGFNGFNSMIANELLSIRNSPLRIPFGKLSFYETDYYMNSLTQFVRLLEKAEVEDISLENVISKIKLNDEELNVKLLEFAKDKTVTDLCRISSLDISNALGLRDKLTAKKIRSSLLINALNMIDLRTVQKNVPDPIFERFEYQFPQERLRRLIESSRIRSRENENKENGFYNWLKSLLRPSKR